MIKLSINLPTRHKLHLRLVKRPRSRGQKPFLPDMGEVLRTKRGSKVSHFFKHIFEHDGIKKLMGVNMAIAIFASSFVPSNYWGAEPEENIVHASETNFKTERPVRYPVETISITQGYRLFHPGLDLDGITGDAIYPVLPGTVEAISRSSYAYGNAILISHEGGLTTLYAHLSKIYVTQGQNVTTKMVIGEMGATGRAFGDHLHLEIRDFGRAINPLTVLP